MIRLFAVISLSSSLLWTALVVQADIGDYRIETLIEGLDQPYAFVFLPNGDILLTEKPGKLRLIHQGRLQPRPIPGLPDILVEGGYTGLMDIALHPRFTENRFVYLSLTSGSKNANATRVIRARYIDGALREVKEIFSAFPAKDTLNHGGGHLAFLPDETLLITIGEGFEFREKAQDLETALGKVVRVNDAGEVPLDNPFRNRAGEPSPIWSYGHRNQLGILYDPATGRVYEHENGPKGGDELNILEAGKNYGWPLATMGLDYSGAYVTPFQHYPGTEPPLVDWTPSIAPSGITACYGCQWPEWEGDLFIGMLAGKQVRRVHIEPDKRVTQEILFSELGERIRNLRFSPDGTLYVLTDGEKAKLLKVSNNRQEKHHQTASTEVGETLYQQRCAQCHESGHLKAPVRTLLGMMSPRAIYDTLDKGAMRANAAQLTKAEKQQIAEYLTGKRLHDVQKIRPPLLCDRRQNWFDYDQPPSGQGWGMDYHNTRFIPDAIARLPVADVKKLRLKWAFHFPEALRASSQPVIAGGGLFVGSHHGDVYALDAESGCQYWAFQAVGEVRTALVVSPWDTHKSPDKQQTPTVYFADIFANVYALNAQTGALRWKVKLGDHPASTITGSPVLYQDQLLVPLSAMGNFNERCCTNRGALVSLDAASGAKRWKTYTIPSPAREQTRNEQGVAQYGPAGASVTHSPTIDEKRGLLYFGTGQNHGSPADDNSDAIFALAIDDGHLVWKTQTTKGDTWPGNPLHPEYDKEVHLDFDFMAAPLLITANAGNDILVAGQKSGEVFGFNPDKGTIVWRKRLGRGGVPGGIHFSMAAQDRTVFVPVHDGNLALETLTPPLTAPPKPGLYALDAFSGKLQWAVPMEKYCNKGADCRGYSAAITAIPGVVFAARRDGELQAFNSQNGQLIWSVDTEREFTTLNGERAFGGSVDGPGPLIVNGTVYINSGYGLYNGVPGNVLLAFSINRE